MKFAVAAIFIVLCSVHIAEGATDKPIPDKVKRISSISSQKTSSLGRYSTQLNRTIGAAGRLDLTPEQKEKIQALKKEYVIKMARQESEARELEKAASESLGKASFDPAAVKQQFKKAQDIEAGLADSYVDALSSLRQIVGNDGYAKVTDPRFALSSDLVQTRQRGGINRAEELDVDTFKQNAPDAGKTGGSDDSADKGEGLGE